VPLVADSKGQSFAALNSVELKGFIDHPLIAVNFRVVYRAVLNAPGHKTSDSFTVASFEYLPEFSNNSIRQL
jgi:hypothetical protein